METENPAVLELLKTALIHDVLIHHMEDDFGAQFTDRYGEDYEKLLRYYVSEKGWSFL